MTRAARRLQLAQPALSQAMARLEAQVGVKLLERHPRGVALTPAGAALVPRAQALLDQAEDLRSHAASLARPGHVRLGYVNWLPPNLAEHASAAAVNLVVDPWVAPSHTQSGRVADGSLDLAVCWIRSRDLQEHKLDARLIGVHRLDAVSSGDASGKVRARDTLVLADDDTGTWLMWNLFAAELARDTGARLVRITDGGITGAAFAAHVRRARRPVIDSPKGRAAVLPAGLVRRPVIDPVPYWTWSLVWRRDETRESVLAAVDALTHDVGDLGIHEPGGWLPQDDPHR